VPGAVIHGADIDPAFATRAVVAAVKPLDTEPGALQPQAGPLKGNASRVRYFRNGFTRLSGHRLGAHHKEQRCNDRGRTKNRHGWFSPEYG